MVGIQQAAMEQAHSNYLSQHDNYYKSDYLHLCMYMERNSSEHWFITAEIL